MHAVHCVTQRYFRAPSRCPTMHFAPSRYLAIHAAQLVKPRNMLQNLVIQRYMLPISLLLDTFYSILSPQDIIHADETRYAEKSTGSANCS